MPLLEELDMLLKEEASVWIALVRYGKRVHSGAAVFETARTHRTLMFWYAMSSN